jgi:hypothetical protein
MGQERGAGEGQKAYFMAEKSAVPGRVEGVGPHELEQLVRRDVGGQVIVT